MYNNRRRTIQFDRCSLEEDADRMFAGEIPDIVRHPSFIQSFSLAGEPSWSNPLGSGDRTDLFLVQEGRGECLIDDMILSLSAGDVLAPAPGKTYELVSSGQAPLTGIVIACAGVSLTNLPEGCVMPPEAVPVVNLGHDFSSVNRYFTDIHAEAKSPTYGSRDLIQLLMQAAFVILLRKLYHAERQAAPTTAMTVKAYIEENFNRDLTLSDLANLVFVSPYHLAHLYKDEMGVSPIQYLIHCRIEEAKRLLQHSNLTIREIASRIGYPNAIYFNLMFKKITGMPPGKYRKKS